MEVILDIIKTKYSFHKHFNIIMIILIILGLILIFIFDDNSNIISKPLGAILLIYVIVNLIHTFIPLKMTKLGNLVINPNSILISYNNEEILIKRNELVKCKFKVKGYNGENNNPRGFSTLKGNHNYINIITKENTYKYEFFIPNQARFKKLRHLIIMWE